MNIEEGEIITLHDGKEYIVVNIININNNIYMNLVSNFKPLKVMIVKADEINGHLVLSEISDQEELNLVLEKI